MVTNTDQSNDAMAEFLVRAGRFFSPGEVSKDLRSVALVGGRDADIFYRDRWSHDKVVRSTHGVNCTGSCSWKVYVKDGIITWETQQTDYPSVGPDSPEYEPRGCPRGAAFSWYTYSPTRVRYPYVRGVLLEAYRKAKAEHPDPVDAWHAVVSDPVTRRAYHKARGKGGLVRAGWSEVNEIIAAAHIYTAKTYGPDRIFGFSPIPAMSMASHAVGARFISLMGGSMLSFYDWYADLPVASPQVFGDQTDVPESADWWNASYLIMWGSNVPVTRTPDAHFMTEARYRGQKVVAVSPDYADNTKFADEWMAPHPGTDGALAMAMGHVILKEFYVNRQVPRFVDYVKKEGFQLTTCVMVCRDENYSKILDNSFPGGNIDLVVNSYKTNNGTTSPAYRKDIAETFARFSDLRGASHLIVLDNPFNADHKSPRRIRKPVLVPLSRADQDAVANPITQDWKDDTGEGTYVYDPFTVLCNATECPLEQDGKVLYLDSNHLSMPGVRLLEPSLIALVNQILDK